MENRIFDDSKNRPELFIWNGKIEFMELKNWLSKNNWEKINEELFNFYLKTGGGTIFESETILGPYGNRTLGDDLVSMNQYYINLGMSKNWLLFHIGLFSSSLDLDNDEIIVFDKSSFKILFEFKTFSDWYDKFLRQEYYERYNLDQ
jgi:hypothetical protein